MSQSSIPHRAIAFAAQPEAAPDVRSSWTLYPAVKLVLDYVAAVLLVVPALPLILVAAVLVRLTSRGPVFYSQVRLGRDGRPFRIHKIRTMHQDAERDGRPRWSCPGDPRVTPVGRVLRDLHIDELPQLLNILRGEMTLVGPRPERPEIVAQLERVLPDYPRRHAVRPGVTGLAQINLPPDTDLEAVRRKLAFDLYYIEHPSLWIDLRIILSTATSLLGVPFAWSRRLLRLPSGNLVEDGAPELAFDGVSEIQPA